MSLNPPAPGGTLQKCYRVLEVVTFCHYKTSNSPTSNEEHNACTVPMKCRTCIPCWTYSTCAFESRVCQILYPSFSETVDICCPHLNVLLRRRMRETVLALWKDVKRTFVGPGTIQECMTTCLLTESPRSSSEPKPFQLSKCKRDSVLADTLVGCLSTFPLQCGWSLT